MGIFLSLVVALLVSSLLLAAWDQEDHPHTHTEVYVLMPPVIPPPPDVPLTWTNSSMFDAANTVIRRAQARRDTQTLMAGMSSTSSPAILLASDSHV